LQIEGLYHKLFAPQIMKANIIKGKT